MAGSEAGAGAPARPYARPFEAVQDARALVKLWLERHLLVYATRFCKKDVGYSDLYVDRGEVDAFLRGEGGASAERRAAIQRCDEAEAHARAGLAARTAATVEAGGAVPLEDFRAAFDIADDRLMDVVLALLATEVDPDLLRACSFAWCDFTRKHVDVGFLLELVPRSLEERDRLLDTFLAGEHPLFRLDVLELEPPAAIRRPLIQRTVRLSDRVIQFLCGHGSPPAEVLGVRGALVAPARRLEDVLVPAEVRRGFLAALAQVMSGGPGRNRLYVQGPEGAGKRALAEAAAAGMGLPLLVADAAELLQDEATARDRLTAFVREARLHDALPYLEHADTCWLPATATAPGEAARAEALLRAVEVVSARYAGPLVLSGAQTAPALAERLPGLVTVRVPHPDRETQRALWLRALPADLSFADGFGVDEVVARYSLTGGAIERAAAALRGAGGRERSRPLSAADVLPVVRDQLAHRLGTVALPVVRGFGWADLVVPARTQSALRELVGFVRHREQIVGAWGFGAKASYGRGVAALFYGPPGTGKTMAASIIATELGMEVFQIDLSRVVDKYIGETEKNLARAFEEGSRAQAILLFDEADSLFARRTSVQSSVDRYANLEVNFLLQRVESYDGVSILTTNFADSIDEAFKRRIRFKVEFPAPSEEERCRIWAALMPPEAPVAPDVSFPALARRYELTGAQIKNVVLRAAAIAAEERSALSMDVFRRAANREYAEMGKLVREEGRP